MYTISAQIDAYCKEICDHNNIINDELSLIKKTLTLVLISNKQIQKDIKESFAELNEKYGGLLLDNLDQKIINEEAENE